jgi:hypothetical protein
LNGIEIRNCLLGGTLSDWFYDRKIDDRKMPHLESVASLQATSFNTEATEETERGKTI